MFGNLPAQAGVVNNNPNSSPNIIFPTLNWDFNNVLTMDFGPFGSSNINDRPRINFWRGFSPNSELSSAFFLSGGLQVLSPAPSGRIIQPWGDRKTGTINYVSSILEVPSNFSFQDQININDYVFSNQNAFDINADGSILVIGSEIAYENTGSVKIFTNNNLWNLEQEVTGKYKDGLFGYSVAINNLGDTIFMGGIYTKGLNNTNNVGEVQIFTGNKNSKWKLNQTLTGFFDNELFGANLSTNNNGSILAVYSELNLAGGGSGIVSIFIKDLNNRWNIKSRITGGSSLENFGHSLKVSDNGEIIVVGSPAFGENDLGKISIYNGNINNGWTLKQSITGESNFSYYGNKLAINNNGSVIFVGNKQSESNGQVFIYTGNVNSRWALKQILSGENIVGSNNVNNFGYDIDTDNKGKILIVNAQPSIIYNLINNVGVINIYEGNAQNGWVLNSSISGNSLDQDDFGFRSKISKDGIFLLANGKIRSSLETPTYLQVKNYKNLSTKIIAGVDVFTHVFAPLKTGTLSPPIDKWTIISGLNPGEIQYQYEFETGVKKPQINIELEYKSDCLPVTVPNCSLGQLLVYVGTNPNNCPIFGCINTSTYFEKGELYQPSESWSLQSNSFAGIGGFGTWSFQSGSFSSKNINNSIQSPVNRNSIGDSAFFIVGGSGSTVSSNRVDLNLTNPIRLLSGSYLSVDVNYGWFGGSREVIFRGSNNTNSQYKFIHSGNDNLRYERAAIINGSPIITNSIISNNVYQKALTYKVANLGTGYSIEVLDFNSKILIYSDLVTGSNVDWNNFITGLSFIATLGGISNLNTTWLNYGLYFNNITFYSAPLLYNDPNPEGSYCDAPCLNFVDCLNACGPLSNFPTCLNLRCDYICLSPLPGETMGTCGILTTF